MDYLCREFFAPQADEPQLIYSELNAQRREVRRVEFYMGGVCLACGGEAGQAGVLERSPFPRDLRRLCRPGIVEARAVSRQVFSQVWMQAQTQPEGLMGLFS